MIHLQPLKVNLHWFLTVKYGGRLSSPNLLYKSHSFPLLFRRHGVPASQEASECTVITPALSFKPLISALLWALLKKWHKNTARCFRTVFFGVEKCSFIYWAVSSLSFFYLFPCSSSSSLSEVTLIFLPPVKHIRWIRARWPHHVTLQMLLRNAEWKVPENHRLAGCGRTVASSLTHS